MIRTAISVENEITILKVIRMLEKLFCITVVKRIICITLLAFEVDETVISEKLNLSLKSIKKYRNMLISDQADELLSIKGNSRKSELEDYRDLILAELDQGSYKNLRQISAMIERLTGLKRSRYRISIFLKKTGFDLCK